MYFSKANSTLVLFLNINTLFISFRHAAGRVWSWRCAGERMHLYLVTSLMNYTTSSNTCSRQTPETDPLYKPSSTLTVCPDCCINTWHQRYPSKSCECLIQTPGILSDICRNVIYSQSEELVKKQECRWNKEEGENVAVLLGQKSLVTSSTTEGQ